MKRQPLKKLSTDENELLKLLERWRTDARKAGYKINRITVAFETGRDGFWLARWLRAHGIEAHVIHAASVAVSREHRRPKTDRLDIRGLKRAGLFTGRSAALAPSNNLRVTAAACRKRSCALGPYASNPPTFAN